MMKKEKPNRSKILIAYAHYDVDDYDNDMRHLKSKVLEAGLDVKLVHTNMKKFHQEKLRVVSYSACIILDTFEYESEDHRFKEFSSFVKYYGSAPLAYIADGSKLHIEDRYNFLEDKFIDKLQDDGLYKGFARRWYDCESIVKQIKQAAETVQIFETSDVRPAFDKFDADGSGAIDLNELIGLLKTLGTEVTDQRAALFMKQLDVNGDGTIDYEEFRDWYLSGFKTQKGNIMNKMNRFSNMVNGISSESLEQISASLQGAGKKMVKRSASLQLNKLEEVKNWVKLSFNLLGKDYKAELAKARDFIELDNNASIGEKGCIFLHLRVPHNDKFTDQIRLIVDQLKKESKEQCLISLDDTEEDWLTVKLAICEREAIRPIRKLPHMPSEIAEYLGQFNQNIEAAIEFGGEPFKLDGNKWVFDNLDQLIKNIFEAGEGFRLKLTANMPKGLIQSMKDFAEKNSDMLGRKLRGLIMPAHILSLLSMNANLTMKFDDVKDILESPIFKEIKNAMPIKEEFTERYPNMFKLNAFWQERLHKDGEVDRELSRN